MMRTFVTRWGSPCVFFVDADAEIGGVGDKALLAGLHGVDEAFTGEGFVFEDAEAAAVEGERGWSL